MVARRRGVLVLAGCALAAALFVPLLDLAVRRGWLPDVGPPPHFRPVRGADGRARADAAGRALWSINPAVAASLADADADGDRLALPREKARGVWRVLSIGESTTFATGYCGRASFSRFLEMRLRARYGAPALEVVNCGKSGYDSHDWPTLARELDDYAPDALVLYVGHNEFKRPNLLGVVDPFVAWLQRSPRARRLLGPPTDRALEPPGVRVGPFLTAAQRGRALADFAAGVRALLEVAARRGIPALVCIPASNVLDHAPRCSVVPAGPDAEALVAAVRTTAAAWDGGAAQLADGGARSPAAALADLAALDALARRAPGAALLHWRRGRILHALARDDEARRAFESALALDELPERASPDLIAALRAVAAETGATLADCEARFARESRGAPGFDLFIDYCHPNLFGHYLVADELVRAVDSLPEAQRPGIASDAREPPGDVATRFATYRALLHFSEEDAARQNFGQAMLIVNELATRADAPAELWGRPREFLDAITQQSAAFERDAEFRVVRALVRAACGEFEPARADLAAARALDASRTAALGAAIGRLPGAVAAFQRAGIAVDPDGFR